MTRYLSACLLCLLVVACHREPEAFQPAADTGQETSTSTDTGGSDSATSDTRQVDTTTTPPDATDTRDQTEDTGGTTITEALREGILGPAPEGDFDIVARFEVRNDLSRARPLQIAYASIPIARSDSLRTTERLVVIDANDQWVQAQFSPVSRWDGALGAIDNDTRPIRWLQVALPVTLGPDETHAFRLRCYATEVIAPNDPLAITLLEAGSARYTLSTGAATFELNGYNPAVIEAIALDLAGDGATTPVYTHQASAGPRMLTGDGAPLETVAVYDSSVRDSAPVEVDRLPGSPTQPDFSVLERGPVKASVLVRGRFRRPQERVDCTDNGLSDAIDPFTFAAVLTFYRGQPHVDIEYHFSNICGDGNLDDFLDQGRDIDKASWRFTTSLTPTQLYASNSGVLHTTGDAGALTVAQSKGRIRPEDSLWERDAYVLQDPEGAPSTFLEREGTVTTPQFAALSDGAITAGVQLAWMRYREPQSVTAGTHGVLDVDIVSEPLHIGEAKTVWNFVRLSFTSQPSNPDALIDTFLTHQDTLERGLLPRALQLSQSRVMPPLASGTGSTFETVYASAILDNHNTTLGYPVHPDFSEPGQWMRAHVFGSQLWPDTPFRSTDPFEHASPTTYRPSLNSGDPAYVELLEFFRTGDPQWVWDFAFPQAHLIGFTGLYNSGPLSSFINGFAATNGTSGEGTWHRGLNEFDLGSSYVEALELAYVLRPSPLWRERFAQAGRAAQRFYDEPAVNEDQRPWFAKVLFYELGTRDSAPGRHLLQALEMLSNCAEFVPGPRGLACLNKLNALMTELVDDNIVDGFPCSGDISAKGTGACTVESLWLFVEQGLGLFHRYTTTLNPNSKDIWNGMLTHVAQNALGLLIPWDETTRRFDLGATWISTLSCTGNPLADCAASTDPLDEVLDFWKLQFLAFFATAQLLDPSLDLCPGLREAFDDSTLLSNWQYLVVDRFGWDQEAAFSAQGMAFALGALNETCF